MSHRIDIESSIDDYVTLTPAERDNLLAMLYCWRDEAVTDALHPSGENHQS